MCYIGGGETMLDSLLVVFACASLIACMPASDPAHIPIFFPPPYAALPAAAPGAPIEPGRPVSLNARQQQAVVVSEMKWMKDAASVQFRGIEAVQNSRGLIAVCGWVNGRNTAGNLVGFQPFVGVLMGPDEYTDFVLVDIGSSDRERAEVTSLCRASGIYGVE
jgi:hypothetical protein